MAKKIPRRLKRFQRRKSKTEKAEKTKTAKKKQKTRETPKKKSVIQKVLGSLARKKVDAEEINERASELAKAKVKDFQKEHSRYPDSKEFDEISKNIYDQLKIEYDRQAKAEKELKRMKRLAKEKTGKKEASASRPERRRPGKKEKAVEKKTETTRYDERRKKRLNRREKAKLMEEEKPARESGFRRRREEKKETEMPAELTEKLSALKATESLKVKDLFAETKTKDTEEKKSLGLSDLSKSFELGSLEDETKLDSLDKGLDTFEKELQTTKNACPNCENKTTELVFCPECGEGFCAHCAKKVEVLTDSIRYTCPKCGKTFKTAKK